MLLAFKGAAEAGAAIAEPEVVAEVRRSKQTLVDLKWSADGASLFAASLDGRIYVHDGRDGKLRTMCASAGAPLASMDLSHDALHVQVATVTHELQFYSVKDGSRLPSPATLRDAKWATLRRRPLREFSFLEKECVGH